MKKIINAVLVLSIVITASPLQSFALSEQTRAVNVNTTQTGVTNNRDGRVKKFNTNTERLNFIKTKFKEVRKKNIGDSFVERDPTLRAKKVRTLIEGFRDRKKNKKEVLVTATGGLESVQSYITNVDESASVQAIGNNMYSVVFQDGKNLDATYFQDIDTGMVPEKLFDFPIVQPVLVTADATIDPSLTGESIVNLWGMTKMETTNYQSGLSLQPNPVAIAIIDTGLDRNHKDLSKNTWINTKEIAGNKIDDDGNGYVDDVNGYDFINGDADPMDDHGHGTHVSGSAAGVVNRGGVFGVNSNAKVLGLKVLSAAGNGSSYDVYRAVYYAANNGIKVINLSLGGAGNPSNDPICNAIDYAKSKGTITVVAAGNSNVNVSNQVPAGCTNAITVGAVGSNLAKASFSNYGSKVDVAAPGISVYSSLPGNKYANWAGTSMATPYIAGLVSAIKTYKPALTVDDIKLLLKNNTLTEPVTSSTNIGRFPNMSKIFTNLGIKSDSELMAIKPPATGSGSTGTGTTTTPPTTGSGTTGTGTTTQPPATGSGSTGTGSTTTPPTTGSGSTGTGSTIPPKTGTGSTGTGVVTPPPPPVVVVPPPVVTPPATPKANIPPTITYTARLVSKNTYELNIVGNDVDGTIKKYEMYFNGQVFATVAKATVRISGGNITVSAKVYDNLGASATSPSITLQYVR